MKSQVNTNQIAAAVLRVSAWAYLVFLTSQPVNGQDQTLPDEVEKRISSTVREAGILQSASLIKIRSMVPGNNTILHIVSEGTRVRKGDFILRLDSTSLKQRVLQKRNEVAEAEAKLVAATSKLEQASKSRSRLGEIVELQKKTMSLEENALLGEDGEITLEREGLVAKQKLLDRRIQFLKKRVKTARSIESEKSESVIQLDLELMDAQSELTQCKRKLEFIEKVFLPSRSAKLKLESVKAQFDLESELTEIAQELAEHEAAVSIAKMKLRSAKNELSETEKNIDRCVILAPDEGIVVYANEQSRTGNDWTPQEGAMVRERQPVVSLTDYKKLKVQALINESRIASVRVGQTAKLRFDALAGLEVSGVVTQVSRFPEPTTWMQSDSVKKYSATVSVVDPPESLRIGMSALVEIAIDSGQSGSATETDQNSRKVPARGSTAAPKTPGFSVDSLVTSMFNKYDVNKNGFIESEELASASERVKNMLKLADANGDGNVDREETKKSFSQAMRRSKDPKNN